ncbi:MAG TPA: VOC family protein [Bryobacteraceae bacterium]|jgi:methylmalonyl-CoA/ethylmalonyl-CoA epimerase|nr:VOC family protein [Bryobacteraceae bacterium]
MEATAAAPFGLATVGQIALTVTDVDRAIAFYRDVLGMKLLFQVPKLGFFACNGIRLMLSAAEKPDEHFGSVIYFKVPDVRHAHATLSDRGAAFEGEPHMIARMPDHELWMAFFRDPDRNLLAIMSEVPLA